MNTYQGSDKPKVETKIINGVKCVRYPGDVFWQEEK